MSKILREYIKTIVESSRVSMGDIAQKRIAAWFISQGGNAPVPGWSAIVNKPGSGASDILVISPDGTTAKVESKNSTKGDLVYSHELTSDSEIAKAIEFNSGSVSTGLSLTRFYPAKNNEMLDLKQALSVRAQQDSAIKNALSIDKDFFQVLFGGNSNLKSPTNVGTKFIKSLHTDGSIIVKQDGNARPALIVLAPGAAGDISRLRFWADGSSRLRSASGGKGQQELGRYNVSLAKDEKSLNAAWRKDYIDDDYFAIVTGDTMHIGCVVSDVLGLGIGRLEVRLNMSGDGRTMAYGGTNISGIREKIMIEISGSKEIAIPSALTADRYIKAGLIKEK